VDADKNCSNRCWEFPTPSSSPSPTFTREAVTKPREMAPGIQTLDDHRRLLDMKEIDAVIVASPLHIHCRHFLDTLAAGKDLYSEKTMTWSIPEAEECLGAAKKSDRVVQSRPAA